MEDYEYPEGYTPQPCPHQPDVWDCSICGGAAYGGYTHRQTRMGIDWMEADDRPSDAQGREEVGRG